MDISKLKEIRDNALSVNNNVAAIHKWEEEIHKEDVKLMSCKSNLTKVSSILVFMSCKILWLIII